MIRPGLVIFDRAEVHSSSVIGYGELAVLCTFRHRSVVLGCQRKAELAVLQGSAHQVLYRADRSRGCSGFIRIPERRCFAITCNRGIEIALAIIGDRNRDVLRAGIIRHTADVPGILGNRVVICPGLVICDRAEVYSRSLVGNGKLAVLCSFRHRSIILCRQRKAELVILQGSAGQVLYCADRGCRCFRLSRRIIEGRYGAQRSSCAGLIIVVFLGHNLDTVDVLVVLCFTGSPDDDLCVVNGRVRCVDGVRTICGNGDRSVIARLLRYLVVVGLCLVCKTAIAVVIVVQRTEIYA